MDTVSIEPRTPGHLHITAETYRVIVLTETKETRKASFFFFV